MRRSERVYFENELGIRLCGIVDRPVAEPSATALFSHCFTCTKDLKAIVKISRLLADRGLAVLRFDFTGLGDSHGDLSETNFATNCNDVLAAARCLETRLSVPQLLIGHSLGGAAMVATIPQLPSVQALATIAAPSSTQHLANHLSDLNPKIISDGEGEVEIGGRTYKLKKQLVDSLRNHDLPEGLRRLTIPHLIIHPLQDATLPYWHAEQLFETTGGPKSFVTLDRCDHLLIDRPEICPFVAELITNWFRYVVF